MNRFTVDRLAEHSNAAAVLARVGLELRRSDENFAQVRESPAGVVIGGTNPTPPLVRQPSRTAHLGESILDLTNIPDDFRVVAVVPQGGDSPSSADSFPQQRLSPLVPKCIEYDKLTEAQKQQARGIFHPTKRGYDGYTYEVTATGWVLSRRKRALRRLP